MPGFLQHTSLKSSIRRNAPRTRAISNALQGSNMVTEPVHQETTFTGTIWDTHNEQDQTDGSLQTGTDVTVGDRNGTREQLSNL